MITPCLGLKLCGGLLLMGVISAQAENLVRNPGFEMVDAQALPVGWELWAPRETIKPILSVEPNLGKAGSASAALLALRPADAGHLQQIVRPIEGSQWYEVASFLRPEGVAFPQESIWMKVAWLNEQGSELEKQFVPLVRRNGAWLEARATLEAPAEAVQARLELGIAWAPGGRV
ncbi:MAG: hypothetical protein ACUVX8_10455, partial [Candidatus Zipacnadales bacterium]